MGRQRELILPGLAKSLTVDTVERVFGIKGQDGTTLLVPQRGPKGHRFYPPWCGYAVLA